MLGVLGVIGVLGEMTPLLRCSLSTPNTPMLRCSTHSHAPMPFTNHQSLLTVVIGFKLLTHPLREVIITFWHEMVEIAAINGASQAIALSHAGIEATAVALADLYGAPTFRVLNLVLEALGL